MKAGRVLLLLICTCLLGGCWDRQEVNDVAFVLGTALDKDGKKYRTTLQVALPSQLSSGGSPGGGGGGTNGDRSYYLESKTGTSIRKMLNEGQENTSRQFNFSHRRTLIIGEELAREGIIRLTDALARTPQNRLSVLIVMAEGNGYKILEAKAPIEQYPAEMVRELAYAYMSKPRTLRIFMTTLLNEGIDPVVPVVGLVNSMPISKKENEKNIKIKGLALFQDDKVVGKMNEKLSRWLLLAMNQAPATEFTMGAPAGKGTLSLILDETRVKITPDVRGDKIRMTIELLMKGELSENQSDYNTSLPPNIAAIQYKAADVIRQGVEESIKVVQKDYGSDVLGFGREIKKEFPEVWHQIKERWRELYPEVEVEVRPKVFIESTRALTKPFGSREGKHHD